MRNQKGITLIALVITIIVLLILAGVSIAMLTGENGILTQANNSRYSTAKAEAVERINLALNAVKSQIYAERVDDADWSPLTATTGGDLQTVLKTTLEKDGFTKRTSAPSGTAEQDVGYYYMLDGNNLVVGYISKSAADITTPITGTIALTSASLAMNEAKLPS